MTDHPNYRDNDPDPGKDETEYNWAERRSELYDRVEQAGSVRNLARSTRELGEKYDVSHTTIQNDLDAIEEFMGDNLADNIEAEIDLLQASAIQDLLEAAKRYRTLARSVPETELERKAELLEASAEKKAAAHRLAASTLRNLQSTGAAPEKATEIEAKHGLTDEMYAQLVGEASDAELEDGVEIELEAEEVEHG